MTVWQSFFFWVGVVATVPPVGLAVVVVADWVVRRRRERRFAAYVERVTREVAK